MEAESKKTALGCSMMLGSAIVIGMVVASASEGPPVITPTAKPALASEKEASSTEVVALTPKVEPIKKEPTDADRIAFTKSDPKMKEAADTIGFLINLNGHLCAQVINVVPVDGDTFEVSCVERRNGSGRVRYSFDTGSNEATPI